MQSKQRSSYHGSEPDSAVSAAVAVSNMASSMQPVPMRRTASVPPDDAASAAKLVSSVCPTTQPPPETAHSWLLLPRQLLGGRHRDLLP